jgi:crotonobetainyl-CoA:carnitine CoA-transferase CaiB-like acyl-CoA transferase
VISITSFGASGPAANRPGFDFIIQAMSGLMAITGAKDGEPMKVGVALTDVISGLYATIAALAALRAKEVKGEAMDHCDVSLMGASMAALVNVAQAYLTTGAPPARHANAHPTIVPYESFPTANGQIAIAAGTEEQFQRLMAVLGRCEVANEPRFASNPKRVAHRTELVALIASLTTQHRTEHLESMLIAADVPCGPVQSVPEARMFWEGVNPDALVTDERGQRYFGLPITMDGKVPQVTLPPPLLGADTAAILTQLGFSTEEIAAWNAEGAILLQP